MNPKSFLGCFLVPADPREPRFRLSQTQFCTKERFSNSVAFLVQTSIPNDLCFYTFWCFVRYFCRCVFLMCFGGVIFSVLVTFGLHFGPSWEAKREKKEGEIGSFLDPPNFWHSETHVAAFWDHFGSILGYFGSILEHIWEGFLAQKHQRNTMGKPQEIHRKTKGSPKRKPKKHQRKTKGDTKGNTKGTPSSSSCPSPASSSPFSWPL